MTRLARIAAVWFWTCVCLAMAVPAMAGSPTQGFKAFVKAGNQNQIRTYCKLMQPLIDANRGSYADCVKYLKTNGGTARAVRAEVLFVSTETHDTKLRVMIDGNHFFFYMVKVKGNWLVLDWYCITCPDSSLGLTA